MDVMNVDDSKEQEDNDSLPNDIMEESKLVYYHTQNFLSPSFKLNSS